MRYLLIAALAIVLTACQTDSTIAPDGTVYMCEVEDVRSECIIKNGELQCGIMALDFSCETN